MRIEDYISVLLEVRSGKPCSGGTRITVADLLEYLAGGRGALPRLHFDENLVPLPPLDRRTPLPAA